MKGSPPLVSLDVRAEKAFTFQRVKLAVDLDIFNLANRATVLGREYDLASDRSIRCGRS